MDQGERMSGISTNEPFALVDASSAYGKPHLDVMFYPTKEALIIGSLGCLSQTYDSAKDLEALTRVQKEVARRKRNLKREMATTEPKKATP